MCININRVVHAHISMVITVARYLQQAVIMTYKFSIDHEGEAHCHFVRGNGTSVYAEALLVPPGLTEYIRNDERRRIVDKLLTLDMPFTRAREIAEALGLDLVQ